MLILWALSLAHLTLSQGPREPCILPIPGVPHLLYTICLWALCMLPFCGLVSSSGTVYVCVCVYIVDSVSISWMTLSLGGKQPLVSALSFLELASCPVLMLLSQHSHLLLTDCRSSVPWAHFLSCYTLYRP